METNQNKLVENEVIQMTKKAPKPRAPRKKVDKTAPVIEEQSKVTEIKGKQLVIIGFDPGFVKLGVAVIDANNGDYIETFNVQLRSQGVKQTQSEVEASVNSKLSRFIKSMYDQYDIDCVVIELQLGQFSCTTIQTAIVANLDASTPFTVQHSKLKFKHPEKSQVENDNKESKQYNQNKQIGRLLAQRICKQFEEQSFGESSFDECDAFLHAMYVYRNKKSIKFVKKQDY